MVQESGAGMLWVGEEEGGTRYRVQVVGGATSRALLIQRRVADGRSGWETIGAERLPVAGRTYLRVVGDLCAHAVAEPINPAYEVSSGECGAVDDEPTSPGFDLRGIGEIFFPTVAEKH